jgi:hypothetical protein
MQDSSILVTQLGETGTAYRDDNGFKDSIAPIRSAVLEGRHTGDFTNLLANRYPANGK